jgi:type II secretion system protein H
MANDAPVPSRPDRGFSLLELLIVVAIVSIMAAVALPNIGRYIRNYKIKGAAQEVAGELQSARNKAIMTNTNSGVSFVVVDKDNYRFVQEDMTSAQPDRLSTLKTLPQGVEFVVPPTLTNRGPTLRFLRLGGFCNPAVTSSTCLVAVPVNDRSSAAERSSSRFDSATSDGLYIGADTTAVMVIRLRETSTSLERTVRIAPGGRVLPQP